MGSKSAKLGLVDIRPQPPSTRSGIKTEQCIGNLTLLPGSSVTDLHFGLYMLPIPLLILLGGSKMAKFGLNVAFEVMWI